MPINREDVVAALELLEERRLGQRTAWLGM
jgi:hypothetical protein